MKNETQTTDYRSSVEDQNADNQLTDRPNVELSVDVLEERIAPGITLNRCETLLVTEAEEVELSVDVLEE